MSETYYGIVDLEGLTEEQASRVLDALEGAIELEPDETMPEEWCVTGPYDTRPTVGEN